MSEPVVVNVKIDGALLSSESFSAMQRQGAENLLAMQRQGKWGAVILTALCAILLYLATEVKRLNVEQRVTQEYVTRIWAKGDAPPARE